MATIETMAEAFRIVCDVLAGMVASTPAMQSPALDAQIAKVRELMAPPGPIDSQWSWIAPLEANPVPGQAGMEAADITLPSAVFFADTDGQGQSCHDALVALAAGAALTFFDAGTGAEIMAFTVLSPAAPGAGYVAVPATYVSGTGPATGTIMRLALPGTGV